MIANEKNIYLSLVNLFSSLKWLLQNTFFVDEKNVLFHFIKKPSSRHLLSTSNSKWENFRKKSEWQKLKIKGKTFFNKPRLVQNQETYSKSVWLVKQNSDYSDWLKMTLLLFQSRVALVRDRCPCFMKKYNGL